jgi:hypothetical protein
MAQGDIFLDIPSVYLPEARVTFLRRRHSQRGPLADLYVLGDTRHVPQQRQFNPQGDELAASVQLGSAMLLTHACEVDNRPRATVSLALVRPLRTVPDASKEAIKSGRNLSFLYLPENDAPPFEESYVDFSRITSLRPDALSPDRRILSSSQQLLQALYVGLVRYFTRFDLNLSEIDDLVARAILEASIPEREIT